MRICFAYDLFRQACGAGDAFRSSRWLYDQLASMLVDAGHDVQCLSESDTGVADSITQVLREIGSQDQDIWAALLSDRYYLAAIARVCEPLRHFDLVVGYELTPNQMRFMSAAQTPFVDISIDPVRFSPDLFLRIRTNDTAALRVLEAHVLPEPALAGHIEQLRHRTRQELPEDCLKEPVLLFAGQTDVDASLVAQGKLASIDPFLETIGELLRPGWQLLLKPHPYGRKHESIWKLRSAFPGARVVNDNIYALLNQTLVRRLATLSSSVALEAALLGRSATTLIVPDNSSRRIGSNIVSAHHRIGPEALSAPFWSQITARAVPAPIQRAPLSGKLRRSLAQSWDHLDTPHLARRRVHAGKKISFGMGGDGLELCTIGWSHPEATGVWSEGSRAQMLIDTDGVAMDLVLDCSGFVPAGNGPVVVEVKTMPGEDPAQHFTFTHRRRRQITIRLPAVNEPVEVSFALSGVTSPAAAGVSSDARLIGLKLIRANMVAHGPKCVDQRRPNLTAFPVRLGSVARYAASVLAAAIGLT